MPLEGQFRGKHASRMDLKSQLRQTCLKCFSSHIGYGQARIFLKTIFRCGYASLFELVPIRSSVGWSVPCYFWMTKIMVFEGGETSNDQQQYRVFQKKNLLNKKEWKNSQKYEDDLAVSWKFSTHFIYRHEVHKHAQPQIRQILSTLLSTAPASNLVVDNEINQNL